jgi:4-carboxymuconolactone decarboxylase
MARVTQVLNKEDVAPEHHAVFDELASLRGRISGPSSIVMHSPGLAHYWNAISEFLHTKSIVEAPDAELAVCTTAREWDCRYVWAAHVPAARAAGVSEDAIKAVTNLQDVDALSDEEATVVRFTRQLLRERRVEGAVFDTLLQAHGPRWMLELASWIGRYSALTGFLQGFEVWPAPEAEQLPAIENGQGQPSGAIRAPLGSPRISPITGRDEVDEADRGIFDAVAEGRGNVRGPFALLMHSPTLCQAVLDLSNYLREDNFISARTRELTVIATARERDCPYVWAAHAPAARKEGVPDAVVEAVRDRGELASMDAGDAAIIAYVRQIMRTHRVEQSVFDRMLAAHSLQGLVELTAVMGHYVFVTTVLNAFEMAPAEGAEALPLG